MPRPGAGAAGREAGGAAAARREGVNGAAAPRRPGVNRRASAYHVWLPPAAGAPSPAL